MTSEEIIEGNKLIAEFNGGEINEYHISGIPKEKWLEVKFERDNEINSVRIDELQYHSSWDWLMPVVEKIGSIIFKCEGWDNSFGYAELFLELRKYSTYHEGMVSSIKSLWWNVIEFIKWYNQTKK